MFFKVIIYALKRKWEHLKTDYLDSRTGFAQRLQKEIEDMQRLPCAICDEPEPLYDMPQSETGKQAERVLNQEEIKRKQKEYKQCDKDIRKQEKAIREGQVYRTKEERKKAQTKQYQKKA